MLSWLHLGDLHITDAGARNHDDLRRIVALANRLPAGSIDFAVLPGDNADDGTRAQFDLVREAVAPLRLPLHILPGDHDFKPGNLHDFHAVLGGERLPYAVTFNGYRCLFLDVVSAGTGGPDFRLDRAQLAWARQQLETAATGTVIFMHTYPADLSDGAADLADLLARPDVLCVDMGHTHYNELANDGGTIFMATRSTGQIEEGPTGFSVAAVDGGCVSWRFKTIDEAFPLVLITRPVDRRLVTDATLVSGAPLLVRAKVVSDERIEKVEMRSGEQDWVPMTPVPGTAARPVLWQARGAIAGANLRVRARDAQGRTDEDRIEPAGAGWVAPQRARNGSDRDRIGAWPEKAIPGTQLGPNRNGRKW